jgi:hypothetical protein
MERDPYYYGVWLSTVTAIFGYVGLCAHYHGLPRLWRKVQADTLRCCAQEVRIPRSAERKKRTNWFAASKVLLGFTYVADKVLGMVKMMQLYGERHWFMSLVKTWRKCLIYGLMNICFNHKWLMNIVWEIQPTFVRRALQEPLPENLEKACIIC